MKQIFLPLLLALALGVSAFVLFRSGGVGRTQADVDAPYIQLASVRKMELMTTQLKDADICASILAYGVDNKEIHDYFLDFKPSQVKVGSIIVGDGFENLRFISVSERAPSMTSELLVLLDTNAKTVVDSMVIHKCNTVWVDHVTKEPRCFGVGLSSGKQLAFELQPDGFKEKN